MLIDLDCTTPWKDAVMVTRPGLSPVTSPDVDTIAIDSFDEDQSATDVMSFPPPPTATAASCRDSRTASAPSDGKTKIDFNEGGTPSSLNDASIGCFPPTACAFGPPTMLMG